MYGTLGAVIKNKWIFKGKAILPKVGYLMVLIILIMGNSKLERLKKLYKGPISPGLF